MKTQTYLRKAEGTELDQHLLLQHYMDNAQSKNTAFAKNLVWVLMEMNMKYELNRCVVSTFLQADN